jgi:starch synthase
VEARGPLGRAATVLSIHNMGYQGWFGADDFWWTGLPGRVLREGSLGEGGALNLLRGGLLHATVNSTVSPTYAKEVMGRSGGAGLDWVFRARGQPVVGILNGIDDDAWNPASDPYTVAPFDKSDLTGKAACKAALQAELGLPVRPDVPLFGIVSRLVAQKGIDLIAGALERLLSLDVQLAVCGSGDKWMEELLARAGRMTGRVGAFFGMNEGLAHRIEAGADLFLMPSKYEPCGLNQMYSQRYGTLPVVRAVGGLDDTVDNFATGFKFWDDSADALAQCAAWAVHVYRHDPAHFRAMQLRAMDKPMGWSHACKQYEALYRLAMRRRAGRG